MAERSVLSAKAMSDGQKRRLAALTEMTFNSSHQQEQDSTDTMRIYSRIMQERAEIYENQQA